MSERAEMKLNSSEFLEKIQNRDNEAVELLVRTYTEALFKGALGLGFDPNSAEELVQSVWTTFFDVAKGFEGRSHVRTFIFGILYNKASEIRRDQKKVHASGEEIEQIVNARFAEDGHWAKPPINPEQFILASESMDLIQKCIDGLPLNQRMAFCLKEIDDHGSSDICNILGVTVTNLGVLLYRARNRLRECIEGKARLSSN
ncbi:MAG: RNA polymerase sigma factor [Bdellovibrionales bacterium]